MENSNLNPKKIDLNENLDGLNSKEAENTINEITQTLKELGADNIETQTDIKENSMQLTEKQIANNKKLEELINEVDKQLENDDGYLSLPEISDDEKYEERTNKIFDLLETQFTEYINGERTEEQLIGGNIEEFAEYLNVYTNVTMRGFEVEDLCLQEYNKFGTQKLQSNLSDTSLGSYFLVPLYSEGIEEQNVSLDYLLTHIKQFHDENNLNYLEMTDDYLGHSTYVKNIMLKQFDDFCNGKIQENELWKGNIKDFAAELYWTAAFIDNEDFIQMAKKEVESKGTASFARTMKELSKSSDAFDFITDDHSIDYEKIFDEIILQNEIKKDKEFIFKGNIEEKFIENSLNSEQQDDWQINIAELKINDNLTIGIDINFSKDISDGEIVNQSALYLAKYDGEIAYTEYNKFIHYEIDFTKDDWKSKLEQKCYSALQNWKQEILQEQSQEVENNISQTKTFLEKAQDLISDFTFNEYGSTPTFDNLEHIGIAYTTSESEELEINVEVDLKHWQINTYVAPTGTENYAKVKNLVASSFYTTEEQMLEALNNLDYEELTSPIYDKELLQKTIGFNPTSYYENIYFEDVQNIIKKNNLNVLVTGIKHYEAIEEDKTIPNMENVLVEYVSLDDIIREDDFFTMLNDNTEHYIYVNPIEYNPITPSKSGNIEQYLERLNSYKEQDLENNPPQKAQNWAIEKLQAAGIEVIEDYDEFERMFDDLIFSGELFLDKKNGIGARAAKVINTSSDRLSNPHYYTNLNNINSQVILIQLKKLDNKISNSDELLSAENFLTELKVLIGATDKHDSVYLRNLINTNDYTLRFSGHNINSANARPNEKTTSLTIKIDKTRFNDSDKNEVIEFVYFKDKLTKERMLGILSGIKNWIKTGEYNYLDCDKLNTSIGYKKKNSIPSIKSLIINEGDVYGFAHENKIYLNPYVLSSQTPIHEYTHLWDNYIQNTNSELWTKGKEAFKNTVIWNEVVNDPNYADIADNDDLVLSECHARITGKVAQKVFEHIAQENGEIKKDEIIDWDKETWQYIAENYSQNISKFVSVAEFIQTPMKDLMEGKNINLEQEKTMENFEFNIYFDKDIDGQVIDKYDAAFGILTLEDNSTIKVTYNYNKEFDDGHLVDYSRFYLIDEDGRNFDNKEPYDIDFTNPNWESELQIAAFEFAKKIEKEITQNKNQTVNIDNINLNEVNIVNNNLLENIVSYTYYSNKPKEFDTNINRLNSIHAKNKNITLINNEVLLKAFNDLSPKSFEIIKKITDFELENEPNNLKSFLQENLQNVKNNLLEDIEAGKKIIEVDKLDKSDVETLNFDTDVLNNSKSILEHIKNLEIQMKINEQTVEQSNNGKVVSQSVETPTNTLDSKEVIESKYFEKMSYQEYLNYKKLPLLTKEHFDSTYKENNVTPISVYVDKNSEESPEYFIYQNNEDKTYEIEYENGLNSEIIAKKIINEALADQIVNKSIENNIYNTNEFAKKIEKEITQNKNQTVEQSRLDNALNNSENQMEEIMNTKIEEKGKDERNFIATIKIDIPTIAQAKNNEELKQYIEPEEITSEIKVNIPKLKQAMDNEVLKEFLYFRDGEENPYHFDKLGFQQMVNDYVSNLDVNYSEVSAGASLSVDNEGHTLKTLEINLSAPTEEQFQELKETIFNYLNDFNLEYIANENQTNFFDKERFAEQTLDVIAQNCDERALENEIENFEISSVTEKDGHFEIKVETEKETDLEDILSNIEDDLNFYDLAYETVYDPLTLSLQKNVDKYKDLSNTYPILYDLLKAVKVEVPYKAEEVKQTIEKQHDEWKVNRNDEGQTVNLYNIFKNDELVASINIDNEITINDEHASREDVNTLINTCEKALDTTLTVFDSYTKEQESSVEKTINEIENSEQIKQSKKDALVAVYKEEIENGTFTQEQVEQYADLLNEYNNTLPSLSKILVEKYNYPKEKINNMINLIVESFNNNNEVLSDLGFEKIMFQQNDIIEKETWDKDFLKRHHFDLIDEYDLEYSPGELAKANKLLTEDEAAFIKKYEQDISPHIMGYDPEKGVMLNVNRFTSEEFLQELANEKNNSILKLNETPEYKEFIKQYILRHGNDIDYERTLENSEQIKQIFEENFIDPTIIPELVKHAEYHRNGDDDIGNESFNYNGDEWRIANGGYDLAYEIYKNDIPVVDIDTDGNIYTLNGDISFEEFKQVIASVEKGFNEQFIPKLEQDSKYHFETNKKILENIKTENKTLISENKNLVEKNSSLEIKVINLEKEITSLKEKINQTQETKIQPIDNSLIESLTKNLEFITSRTTEQLKDIVNDMELHNDNNFGSRIQRIYNETQIEQQNKKSKKTGFDSYN